jgi:hypothetical protein
MYLQGKLTIDLTDTDIEMRPPRNFFGGLANLLTRGHWGTPEAMETYKLLAFVQSANRALRQLGVQNVIRVALGDDVIYEDKDDTPDDLATAMQTLQDKVSQGYEPDPHVEFDMLLKHDDGALNYVIDLDFVREHQVDVDPIVMTVTATPSPFQRRREEDEDTYQQRISWYFETRDRFDQAVNAWEERLTSFLNQIADHFRTNFGIAGIDIKTWRMWPDARDPERPQALTMFGAPLYGYDPTYDLAHMWLWETLRAQHSFLNRPMYVREREPIASDIGSGAADMGSGWGAHAAGGGSTVALETKKGLSDSGGGGWLSHIGDFFSDSGGGGSVDGGSSDSGGGGSSDSGDSSCGGGGCGGGSSD